MSSISFSLSNLEELLPQLFQSDDLPGSLYLRCQLANRVTTLFSLEYVRESLVVEAEQITAIPQMSPFVLGLMSSRDQVFCLIDLPQLLGFSALPLQTQRYYIVIISVSSSIPELSDSQPEILLGLAVNEIIGVTRVLEEELKSPLEYLPKEQFFSILTPYLQGWFITEQESLPILDIATIIQKTF
ncbi:chemotaxis protein CheW [Geminocystis sp. GBBB08]|uniref:chemotaxis protein CheW n=1 Tax=Geminocystis sp. GBBB08 TaxID=2604140 RepID=UPI0027E21D0A|nr:chemotaxis protein CheW [Geminocystis sp. GBBB08]MBL1209619.1 hypothetical protein [Geminocystis sp. GBBB08]